MYLNHLGNYIPDVWSEEKGCVSCAEGLVKLPAVRSEWPRVTLAVMVEQPTPFLLEVLEHITRLDYPKKRMSLWVHNAVGARSQYVRGACYAVCLYVGLCIDL